jgi:hypothetical protein
MRSNSVGQKKKVGKKRSRNSKNGESQDPSLSLAPALALVRYLERIAERFGLVGAFLLAVFVFVVAFASKEQKVEIIDLFLLGKGIENVHFQIMTVGVALALLVAQGFSFSKRVKSMQGEIDRLAKWKTDHQQREIPLKLNHVDQDRK